MPRKTRVDYPGAWHHVMHRGRRRQPIFRDDSDALVFLSTLAETVDHYRIEVHAYSLMPNHYHLLCRSPFGTLSRAMQHLNGVFTQRINGRHGWDGSVFRGRFKNQVVENDDYLRYLVAYIHLNPLRAKLVRRIDSECWTSHRALTGREAAPSWLSTSLVGRYFDDPADLDDFVRGCRSGHEQWPEEFSVPHGWTRGGREDAQDSNQEPIDSENGSMDSERLLEDICDVCDVTRAELTQPQMGRGANPARRFAVYTLSREPLLRRGDIALALGMSTNHVSQILYQLRTSRLPFQFEEWTSSLEQKRSANARQSM